jgi:hypothetical protein
MRRLRSLLVGVTAALALGAAVVTAATPASAASL